MPIHAVAEPPTDQPTPGKLVGRYILVLGAIGLGLIGLMTFVGWMVAFWLPALALVGLLSVRLGVAAGYLALLGPVALAALWVPASIAAATLAFPDDEVSQSWSIFFLFIGVASAVLMGLAGTLVGTGTATGSRWWRARRDRKPVI